MLEFTKINNKKELYLGEIVYKGLLPGHINYDLPEKYARGGSSFNGDYTDYYHVGVVTCLNPLEITHCTSPGPIVRDNSLGKWAYGGKLKGVDYNATEPEKEVGAMVTLKGGNESAPLNMRASRDTHSALLAQIPQGTEVELLDAGETWSRIKYDGKTGFVLTKFVQSGTDDHADEEKITVNRAELEQVYDIIGDMLGLRG